MDWTIIADALIACAGVIANAFIINGIGNRILTKSKKELQQMQQEHEKEMQKRQQNFETFLLNTKETKEQKDKEENAKHDAINQYCNNVSKFLSYSYDNDAFAKATGAYLNILKYAPKHLYEKITDLNDTIITIHNTDNSFDENGITINNRMPLEIKASHMFTEICQEWNDIYQPLPHKI